ncbi:steroid receptor RNA activator 1 [Sphaeramia orbicularis]|uniref:Steroid receptor RNA activator 1 n=1 Tax=Sphaeramia orbicularis TaxID=375764 RepID=A0A673BPT8_9TELE|nr:steroid receptor RNA activator 1 [Sphaeramia orbicularis]
MMESNTEDKYVKPGNQDRGWNDPPQFSYGLQMARGPQRNLLNRRPTPSAATVVGPPPMMPPSTIPLTPPKNDVGPPPLCPARPPGCVVAPPPSSGPVTCQSDNVSSQSESEADVEDVLSVFNKALSACRPSVSGQVCNDVAKRLRLLEESWRAGRLSLPVQRRMKSLALELQSGHWDSADEMHRSLMVDYVTEVSQWMVGVKRLIAETRKLSPELLESLRTSEDQAPAGPEPDESPAEPEPNQNPGEPDQNLAGPDQNPDPES